MLSELRDPKAKMIISKLLCLSSEKCKIIIGEIKIMENTYYRIPKLRKDGSGDFENRRKNRPLR